MNKLKTVTFDASEAKNKFGAMIDAAQRRPVTIKRRGRPVAFVISPADMETIEDIWLGARAMQIMKTGKFLGVKKTREYFDSVLKKNA